MEVMGTWRCVFSACKKQYSLLNLQMRQFSASTNHQKQGLIVGLYSADKAADNGKQVLTKAGQTVDKNTEGKLMSFIELSGSPIKKHKCRQFYGITKDYPCVSVVGLGDKGAKYNSLEQIDERRENIRIAVANAAKIFQDSDIKDVFVDPCGDSEAAAEGVKLALFSYDDLKAKDKKKSNINTTYYLTENSDKITIEKQWFRGKVLAKGQNLARRLMEMPSNHLTPTAFCDIALEKLAGFQDVDVIVRDEEWAQKMKMGAFLAVGQGSSEPLKFLEIIYRGEENDNPPLVLVGKGVTFDTGGISIKPSASMDLMRGDMGGAACTLGAIYSVAKLQIPINLRGLIPLCENMPSGTAIKPGDVVKAMNGKTIQIDNTDAEGRLILADALCYAESFKPSAILDMATLTGAMAVALGDGATGTFTNSDELWDTLQKAGSRTGDRVWRMPLWDHYSKKITECQLADLNNIGKGRGGGSCTAAAFLKEFVTSENWLHLDIAGVMESEGGVLNKGMSGRPTRTIVEFISMLAAKK